MRDLRDRGGSISITGREDLIAELRERAATVGA